MRPFMVVVVGVLLSGCGQAPAPEPVEDPADFDDLDLESTPDTGVIRGVVVDEAIYPVHGATVALALGTEYTTDKAGRFGFSNVEPGLHRLAVTKPGYSSIEQVVDVVAGIADPAVVKVIVQRLPGTEPFIVPNEWTGSMECSASVGGFFFSGCMIPAQAGLGDDSRRTTPIDAPPAFLQSELYWKATQQLGSDLCMRTYPVRDGSLAGRLEPDACGPSPQVQRADTAFLVEHDVGNGTDIERVVWVSERSDLPIGWAMSQEFTVYTHLFYNFLPDPDWLFVRDGEHPLP